MDNKIDIKPCPHCGGGASVNYNYSRRYRSYFVFVRCDICGAQGKIYNAQQEPDSYDQQPVADAVAAWNLRQPEGG